MIKKEDFQATYDCWIWLSENPNKNKRDWFDCKSLRYLRNQCAFCEYFLSLKTPNPCKKCYLMHKLYCCQENYSAYQNWNCAKRLKTKAKYALQIAEVTKEYMKQEGMWDE